MVPVNISPASSRKLVRAAARSCSTNVAKCPAPPILGEPGNQ